MTRADWYRQHGCTHAHCPYECEHPQPILDEDTGELFCGRCWFIEQQRTLMVPCTEKIC
jgi:hypothetical protein